MTGHPAIDPTARALAAELRSAVRGEVRFGPGDRALYSTDASNYRQVPIGVVVPRDAEDVVATVRACREHGAPLLSRGGGTSLAGQCCNVAVVMDFSKYLHHVVELDPERRLARVEPGCVLDRLRDAAEEHHLTFGPDPATHDRCTFGGMIGNNSCGVHSVMAGRTVENVEELEVLTYDGVRMRVGKTSDEESERLLREGGRKGEIVRRLRVLREKYAPLVRERFPDIPRRVSGYNLDQLLPENGFHLARALVGTESTCVTVLEATVRLVHSPPKRSLLVLGYPDVFSAGDHVPEILEHGPVGLEGMDDELIRYLHLKKFHLDEARLLPEGGGWLLVEFGGEDQDEADARAREAMEALRRGQDAPSMKLFSDPHEQSRIWEVRESGLGATANVPTMRDTWPGWEDSAVPPDRVGEYLRDFRGLLDRYGYQCALYGHFGDGCIHTRIDFDLKTREGIDTYLAFLDEAADAVLRYGGSLSGEHGDGQARGALLPKMYGDELMEAFREFKSIWDPDGKMNPGKVIDADRPDENLRLGTGYNPWEPATEFQYPADGHSFSRAQLRCVGVGKCRRTDGGTMCPSYMVTLEEKHSTRGRARLLFEMLERDAIGRDGWRDEAVKEALDLCLACKGCKGDCPVQVDMATYKAEFLSHYYENRLRPRSAYAFGLIYWWSRLASRMPRLANFATQTPGLAALAKAAAGVAPERKIPAFAPETFTEWFSGRPPANPDGPRVLLWPDTFNNHFHPDVAQAAVEVLEATGFSVGVPPRILCCGRPLYDFGMLDLAKRQLLQILEVLRGEIRAGTPIVVLEPSCASTFRDELPNLFPHDEDARRLAEQTLLLGELLAQKEEADLPQLRRKAVVHQHCHHKSVLGTGAEERLLERLGLDFQVLDSGCCGMAGSFGFEEGDRYEVAVACGERVLLPAVRAAERDALIVTDGFSCREQIAQRTGRRALHTAQVLQMALREGPEGPRAGRPEDGYTHGEPPSVPAGAILGGAALAGALLGWTLGGKTKKKTRKDGRP